MAHVYCITIATTLWCLPRLETAFPLARATSDQVKKHLAYIIGLAAIGLAVLTVVRGARPHQVASVRGQLVASPEGSEQWVAWIDGKEGECRLVAARIHARTARVVLTAPALSGLVVSGQTAYLTRREGPESELLRVDLPSGKAERRATVSAPAAEIVVGEKWLCWREHRPAGLPGVPFVAAGVPLNVIRACPTEGGNPALVAPVTGEAALLGIAGGAVYWVERQGVNGSPSTSTVVRRAALPGGKPETVLVERGWRSVALADDALVWSAPSAEAAEPDQVCAIKRRPLDRAETVLIGDWIDPWATLLPSPRGLYVQDRYRLWQLGDRRRDQRALHEAPMGFSGGMVAGDEEYVVLASSGRQKLAVVPLTLWGKIRRCFQP